MSKALPVLRNMLVNDESSDVRRYVAVALGEAFGELARSLLELRLEAERDPGSLVGIFSALYALGDAERLDGMLAMLDSDDSELLHQALNALAEVQREDVSRVGERVNALLGQDIGDGVRSAAERVLAGMREWSARPG